MKIPGVGFQVINKDGGYAVVNGKKIFEVVDYFNAHKRIVRVTGTQVVDEPQSLRGYIQVFWLDEPPMIRRIWRGFLKFLWR